MEALQLLSRNEMKMIKGGIGGNVHCNISGNQFSCDGSLLDCLDACDGMADGWEVSVMVAHNFHSQLDF